MQMPRPVRQADAPARGDDFDSVFRQHAAAVARWVAALGGPLLDVEDTVQEVFMVAHRRLSEFRGDAKVSTWLFQITRRVVQPRTSPATSPRPSWAPSRSWSGGRRRSGCTPCWIG